MTIQTFTAGQKLTALQMNTLQASDFNFTRNVRTDSSYTFALSDKGKLVESTNAGSAVFTIPLNSTAEFSIGDRIDTLLASDGSLEIVGASGVTLYAEGDLTTISSKWTRVTLIKRATDSWVMTGSGMSIQTVELDDLAVTTAKLADSSVTSAKIVDGTIVNADVNTSAAIALSKLASGTSAQVVVANSGGVPTYTTLSGDVTIGNTGVTAIGSGKVTSSMILDGTIVDGDVSSSASIALSKLATGALPTAITIASANIVDGTIVDGDISASAAISLSKLATGALPTAITVTSANISDLSIVNADVSTSAAIAYSKLNLGTSIVDGDISASASVALSKLATGALPTAITIASANIVDGTIVNADISSSASISYSKLSLSGSITTTDLATGAARSGFRSPIVAQQGATHTIAASDVGGLVVLSSCTSVVIPTADGTFTVGDRIDFLQTGSQVVTFSATAPQTVGGFDSQTKLGGQYAVATLVKYAANTWVLVGNITS